MSDYPKAFYDIAVRWEDFHSRSVDSIMDKLQEEVEEFYLATKTSDRLDEIGDIIANAMRLIVRLPPEQMEFVLEAAKMKLSAREKNGKDKKAEAILRKEMIKKYTFE